MQMAYQQQLRELLQLIAAGKLKNTRQLAQLKGCHRSSIERRLRKLRQQGYSIVYDRKLQRYVLREEE